MSRYHAYLKKAVSYLENYQGDQPFSLYCKQLFAADRKMGATDRRLIRQYCYAYFRIGPAFPSLSLADQVVAAVYLLSDKLDPLVSTHKPEWAALFTENLEERLQTFPVPFHWDSFLVDAPLFSTGIELKNWLRAQWIQPDVFIRLRPGKEKKVWEQIDKMNLPAQSIATSCVSFPSSTNLDLIQELNRDFVIQDFSSQQIGQFFEFMPRTSVKKVWDSCAASGGKSLLAVDCLPAIQLTVSDIRSSMLIQLKNRFKQAGVSSFTWQELNLEKENAVPASFLFDLVIADVPCTGSGTWGRTPEQRLFYTAAKLNEYVAKQKRILNNLHAAVKPGGYFLYCTCSVFQQENEAQINWFAQQFGFAIMKMQLFNGSVQKADSLFAALLQKANN